MKLHRPLAGEVKTLTSKNEGGKWYAFFSCIVDAEPLPLNESVVGMDVGLESFAVTSDAEIIDNPRYDQRAQKELRPRQRQGLAVFNVLRAGARPVGSPPSGTAMG